MDVYDEYGNSGDCPCGGCSDWPNCGGCAVNPIYDSNN